MNKILIWGNNIFLPIFGIEPLYIRISAYGTVMNKGEALTLEQVTQRCNGEQEELPEDKVLIIGTLHTQQLSGYNCKPLKAEQL